MRPSPRRLGRSAVPLVVVVGLIAVIALFLFALSIGPIRDSADESIRAKPDSSVGSIEVPAPEKLPNSESSSARAPLPEVGASAKQESARPRGVVLDASTREPLPAYLLGFYAFENGARTMQFRTSDASGRFELGLALPLGRIRIELIDDHGLGSRNKNNAFLTRDLVLGPDGRTPEPIELLAESGPTCFFECEFPAQMSFADFEVRLSSGRPVQRSFQSLPAIRAPLRVPNTATLHTALPWVRFAVKPHWRGASFVELRSQDGRWRGGNWIESSEGINATPVRVVFESATWLTADVPKPEGATSDGAAFRLIERTPLESKQVPRKHAAWSSAKDGLRFDFLEPGEYRLFTHDRHWFPFERDVTVARGENDLGTITLVPRPVVGSIRGTIESKSGKYEGACHVSLSNTPFEHDALFDHSIDFEDDGTGKLVAQFEFENVTAGDWFLYVHCHDGFVHSQSLRTVIAPADDVRIVLEDLAATVEIVLVDAASGEVLGEDSAVSWRVGEAFDRADGPHIRLEGLPDTPERITFLAEAPGYRPLRLSAADFERVPASESSATILRATCKLERGFGGVLRLRDRSGGSPIEGAEVLIDGVPSGSTDADGEFWIELNARPGKIALRKQGWLWVPTRDVDSRTGKLGDGPEFDAAMERLE